MRNFNRRRFIAQSLTAAGSVAVAPHILKAKSPNDKIGVVVVGAGGRGSSHIGYFLGNPSTEIMYIADADEAKRQNWSRPLGAKDYDIIHAFTKSRDDLVTHLPRLRRALKSDGMIWVSWPKKSAKVPTDVTEDVIRDEALKHDLVDVKVAAVDNVWSGLKLVVRVNCR